VRFGNGIWFQQLSLWHPTRSRRATSIVALLLIFVCEKLGKQMLKTPLGEYNMGALAGAVVGSIGGLFAIGVVRAILGRNIALLLELQKLGLMSFLICGIAGWLAGGQIGPRFGEKYYSQRAEILGGALGGVIPVLLVALWALYMSLR
jgi:hypothetical protein